MSAKLETLSQNLRDTLGDKIKSLVLALNEVTIEVAESDYLEVSYALRDAPSLGFEDLVDLCGVDYSTYGGDAWDGKRFASVAHLLSVTNNWRLRLLVFAEDDQFPSVASVTDYWR